MPCHWQVLNSGERVWIMNELHKILITSIRFIWDTGKNRVIWWIIEKTKLPARIQLLFVLYERHLTWIVRLLCNIYALLLTVFSLSLSLSLSLDWYVICESIAMLSASRRGDIWDSFMSRLIFLLLRLWFCQWPIIDNIRKLYSYDFCIGWLELPVVYKKLWPWILSFGFCKPK